MLNWQSDFSAALGEAKKLNRPLLMFFHSVHCSGCKSMIAKTLPDNKVSARVGQRFVPAMFEVGDSRSQDLVKKYAIEWTPTFVIADDRGNEAYRIVGYLPPEDYLAELTLGEGKLAFKNGDYDRAEKCFENVHRKHPLSQIAPEAMYYAGVSRYKKTHEVAALNKACDDLRLAYPDSNWTKKASVWAR